jgi:hypothetical protein
VAALGAAAAQHGGASLGGHAAQKAVDLAPAAAIRLKGALRHRRILFSIFGIVASLPASPEVGGLYVHMHKRVWQQLLSIPKFPFEGNSIVAACLIVCTVRVSNFPPTRKSSPTLVQTLSLSLI